MSQHDYIIDNQLAPAFRADLNAALNAAVTQNSGLTAPTTTYANMVWYDTANDLLKVRNEANSGWITMGTIDQTNSFFNPNSAPTVVTDVQTFAASGTWTKPATAKFVYVRISGGGGGGGSGRTANSGSASNGGGGGDSGDFREYFFTAADLPSTVIVTLGAGGTGGAGTTGTSGNDGTVGGTTSFGAYYSNGGGIFGDGSGINSGGRGGDGYLTTGTAAQAGIAADVVYESGGGGGGGGISSGNVTQKGGAGGGNTPRATSGGAAGASSGAAGATGGAYAGGGGGFGGISQNGGAGGNGGFPSGGGGGGAGTRTGFTSGKGGDGAAGYAEVISW